ncbi:MAG TPA: methyl-accepting chemotaxis protein [Vicinamibacterales bacterium]|nr:methyl-accepting chemotaxis protein [Vicinamibacterales bacterium]
MRNLKVWQKLALMGAVFMVPFAVITYKMISSIDALGVEFTRQEIRGLEYYGPAGALMKSLQLHRGLPGETAGADVERDLEAFDSVDQRLGATLHVTEQWVVIRDACRDLLGKTGSLAPEDSFARHSRLIADVLALMAAVGHASNLTLDPDVERRHLIDVLVFAGPELRESLARARALGVDMLAASDVRTREQQDKLRRYSTLAEYQASKVDQAMADALKSDEALRTELEAQAGDTSAFVLDAMAAIVTLTASQTPVAADDYSSTMTKGVDAIGELDTHIAAALTSRLHDRVSALWRDMLVTLAGAGVGLLVVAVIGFFIIRDITATLTHAVKAANRIAIGDLNMPATAGDRADEIGVLSQSFARMVDTLKETVVVAQRIASGDLAVTVQPRSEHDVMGNALANMVEQLSSLVGEVQRSGIQVNASVNEIAATARQQQATATEIAATTTEIGATSREISATSKALVKTMSEVSTVAEQSAALAGSGQAGLTHMEETMRQVMDAAGSINAKLAVLNQKAGNITQVVTTITKVADQTNLLSLNAAIEAEKAGEYGRGFAVVATEIRRLADQTAVATYDIEQMVKEIQSAVSAGVMGMDKFSEEVRRGIQDVQQVSHQLTQIIHQVQTLAPRFEAVNEGMQAQATGAEQISHGLSQLTEAAQQTVESLHQSNAAIDGLNQAATQMRNGVSRFTLAA